MNIHIRTSAQSLLHQHVMISDGRATGQL